jgi:hypothetical protein
MKLLIISALFMLTSAVVGQETRPQNECVRVTASSATLRGRPSLTGKALDIVTKRTQLESIAKRNEWVLVQAEDYTGWIEAKWLEPCNAGTVSKTPVLGPSPAAAVPANPSPAVASTQSSSSETRSYTKGPKGGCYYMSSSGRKVYVDHSLCN